MRAGVTFPEQAEATPTYGAEVDLGYFFTPPFRTLIGLTRFTADIDREPGGDEGSYRAIGLSVGGRYDFLQRSSVAPYLRVEAAVQRVSADAFDADVGALLRGTYVGIGGAAGARYLIDAAGRLSATAEVRRNIMNNIASTALEIGVRFQPRGFRSYRPEPGYARPRTPAVGPVPDGAAPPPAAAAAPPQSSLPGASDAAALRRQAEAARQAQARRAADATARQREEEVGRLHSLAREAMLRQGLQRAAMAMPGLATFQEATSEFVVTVGGTAFASGAGTLVPSARVQMRVLATVLAGYPGHVVLVEGHADASGDRQANQGLSEERAAAVRAALIAEGADPLWVGSRGHGSDAPIASNATAAGRAANRRVEIRVSRGGCATPPIVSADGMLTCQR